MLFETQGNASHIRTLFTSTHSQSFLHSQFRVLTLKNGSPSWLEQLTLCCLSFIPLGLCARFFCFPLFRRQLVPPALVTERFPICFRLPLAAVGLPPAIWASVASPLALLSPDGSEGGMEGREGGTRELGGQTLLRARSIVRVEF